MKSSVKEGVEWGADQVSGGSTSHEEKTETHQKAVEKARRQQTKLDNVKRTGKRNPNKFAPLSLTKSSLSQEMSLNARAGALAP